MAAGERDREAEVPVALVSVIDLIQDVESSLSKVQRAWIVVFGLVLHLQIVLSIQGLVNSVSAIVQVQQIFPTGQIKRVLELLLHPTHPLRDVVQIRSLVEQAARLAQKLEVVLSGDLEELKFDLIIVVQLGEQNRIHPADAHQESTVDLLRLPLLVHEEHLVEGLEEPRVPETHAKHFVGHVEMKVLLFERGLNVEFEAFQVRVIEMRQVNVMIFVGQIVVAQIHALQPEFTIVRSVFQVQPFEHRSKVQLAGHRVQVAGG